MARTIVRALQAGEARRFEEIRIAGWHAAYRGILHPDVLRDAVVDEERIAWRERWLADPPSDEVHLVAEVDGQVAAGAYLRPTLAGEAELASLYVDPDRRGTGLGGALLEEGFHRMPHVDQVLWTFEEPIELRYRRSRS